MRVAIFLCVASLLASCASNPYPASSPYYQIPSGSQIELKQSLSIPPDRARVYLQHGKVVSASEKNRYAPHCWFLSQKLSEDGQVIQPDTFVITSTYKSQDLVQNFSNQMLASNSLYVDWKGAIELSSHHRISGGGDALMAVDYISELRIHSDKQPDIQRMGCSHWDDPSMGNYLTLDQMQSALGDIALIVIDKH